MVETSFFNWTSVDNQWRSYVMASYIVTMLKLDIFIIKVCVEKSSGQIGSWDLMSCQRCHMAGSSFSGED